MDGSVGVKFEPRFRFLGSGGELKSLLSLNRLMCWQFVGNGKDADSMPLLGDFLLVISLAFRQLLSNIFVPFFCYDFDYFLRV